MLELAHLSHHEGQKLQLALLRDVMTGRTATASIEEVHVLIMEV